MSHRMITTVRYHRVVQSRRAHFPRPRASRPSCRCSFRSVLWSLHCSPLGRCLQTSSHSMRLCVDATLVCRPRHIASACCRRLIFSKPHDSIIQDSLGQTMRRPDRATAQVYMIYQESLVGSIALCSVIPAEAVAAQHLKGL
jgi:hypothetical protein